MTLPPLRSKRQYDFMKAREEPAYEVKSAISEEDVDYIYQYWRHTRADREFLAGQGFSDKDVKKNVKKGALKYPYTWDELGHVLEPIVEKILGTDEYTFITGRLYTVSKEYTWDNIHTDGWNYLDKIHPDGSSHNNGPEFIKYALEHPDRIYMVWKTIVIPLYVKGDASTIIFDQYNYSPESVAWNKHYDRIEWPGAVKDYTEYMTNEMTISSNDYNKYLSHCLFSVNRLKGLSIQSIQDWKVGNAYVWDSSQLHIPGKHNNDAFKVGLTIWLAHPKGAEYA